MGKLGKMAKSKNHTSHNQGYKNHRNGIHKVKRQRHVSNKMVNQKLIRNTRRARRYDPSIKKQANLEKRIKLRRELKVKFIEKVKQLRVNKLLGIKKNAKVAAKKEDPKKKVAGGKK